MTKRSVIVALLVFLGLVSGVTHAQEATIHHGFLFFAGEKYTVDEKSFGIYDDGNEFQDLIKDNAKAIDQFHNYQAWHTTAIVSTSLSIASFAFGGVYYMFEKDLSESLGENAGLIGFITGGGLLVLGMVFEFISWGSISGAAEAYNRGLMDEGGALKTNGIPLPTLALAPGGAHMVLTWRY